MSLEQSRVVLVTGKEWVDSYSRRRGRNFFSGFRWFAEGGCGPVHLVGAPDMVPHLVFKLFLIGRLLFHVVEGLVGDTAT